METQYDPMPTVCGNCHKPDVKYGRLSEFGLKEYLSGYCYYCPHCGAYIGTHRKNPLIALGIMTNSRDIKLLRIKCHEEEEKHYSSSAGRQMLRYILAKQLSVSVDECHFGYMEEDKLREALGYMQEWGEDIHFDNADALRNLASKGIL